MYITQPYKMHQRMQFSATWMDLKVIILSKVSQTLRENII